MRKGIKVILEGAFLIFISRTCFAFTPIVSPPAPKQTPVDSGTTATERDFSQPQYQLPEVQKYIQDFQEQNSKFIDALIDPQRQLPYDAVYIREDGTPEIQHGATTGSEIGFWLVYLTNIAKGDIKVSNITPQQALVRLNTALTNIERLPKWKGLLYKYNFQDNTIDKMACIFDNGNFAASLGTVIGAFADEQNDPAKKQIADKAKELLDAQKPGWQALYDKGTGLLWGDYRKGSRFDILGSEGRLGAIMSIVAGDDPTSVWTNLKQRTESYTLSDGRKVEIMPPYEGAFQMYFPLMFVPEDEWSGSFAKAHNNYAAVQIDYANKTGLPALRSASANPYQPYKYSYAPGSGVPGASLVRLAHSDIGAPYATAFLNLIDPEKATKMFQGLEEFTQGKIWGPYGMYDAVGKNGEVSKVYISLDHLAMLISTAGKANQKYFTKFLKEEGKLDLVKSLYQQTDIPISEKAALPEVKKFSPPAPSVEKPAAQGTITLLDFEHSSEYVSGAGHWDGPQTSDYIQEETSYDTQKGTVLKANYKTSEYNGLFFDLIKLDALDNYKTIKLDLKASPGMKALKIEIKGSNGGWMHYYLRNIGKNWQTFEIPIKHLDTASWEKRFQSGEIPVELVITVEGSQLAYNQRKGTFWVDNIKIESK